MKTMLRLIAIAATGFLSIVPTMAAPVGSVAPNCEWKLFNGEAVNLRQFHGQIVYVDFWASWCAPCALSFPFMNDLTREFQSRGLKIVGVDMDENIEDANRFLSEHPAHFTIASGPNQKCAIDLDVHTMPSTLIVGRDGVVRVVQAGFRPSDRSALRASIDKLLSERATP